MKFVTDDMMHVALEYLGQYPHPAATLRGDLTRAENLRHQKKARLMLSVEGKTISEKECRVECEQEYIEICGDEADASEQYEAARSRINWANTVIEVWRSQQATERYAEKVR